MREWLGFVLGSAAVCAGIYLLYRRGWAVTRCTRALLFVFRRGKEDERASVQSCTGWLQHVKQFREDQMYTFSLDEQLSEGDVEISLLDRKKQLLLKLDRHSPSGSIALEGNSRYYLRWNFKRASGQCALRWQSGAAA